MVKMCGIFGAFGDLNNYKGSINDLIKQSARRGSDAVGFLGYNHSKPVIDNELEMVWKKNISSIRFFQSGELDYKMLDGILGHTRTAVKGSADDNKNNHPFESKSFIWAHNGGLRNFGELKNRYKLDYDSECDSAVIGNLLQKFVDDGMPLEEAFAQVYHELDGYFAVWVYHKPTQDIYIFRNNGRPLHWFEDKGIVGIASDPSMLRTAFIKNSFQVKEFEFRNLYLIQKGVVTDLGDLNGMAGEEAKTTTKPDTTENANHPYTYFLNKEGVSVILIDEGYKFIVKNKDIESNLRRVGITLDKESAFKILGSRVTCRDQLERIRKKLESFENES